MQRSTRSFANLAIQCLKLENSGMTAIMGRRCLAESGTQLRHPEQDSMQAARSYDGPLTARNASGTSPAEPLAGRYAGILQAYGEAMQGVLTCRGDHAWMPRTHTYFVGLALRAARYGRGECMKDVLEEMPLDGFIPTRKLLRMALDAAILSGDSLEALLALSELRRHGIRVTNDMHAAILQLVSQQAQYVFALEYSEELYNRGVYFSERILKALHLCYAKLGKLDQAIDLLDQGDASGKTIHMDAFVFTMEAAVEAHKKSHKTISREQAAQHVEQIFEQAVKRFNLEYAPSERDMLLSSTMSAYRALEYYAAARDAYSHIKNKTPKRRSQYIVCIVQEAVDTFLAVAAKPGHAWQEEYQDLLKACAQAMEELQHLLGLKDQCMQMEDACQIMAAVLKTERVVQNQDGELEGAGLESGMPLELANRILDNIGSAGLALPQRSGSSLILEALQSDSVEHRNFGEKVLALMESAGVEPHEYCLDFLQRYRERG